MEHIDTFWEHSQHNEKRDDCSTCFSETRKEKLKNSGRKKTGRILNANDFNSLKTCLRCGIKCELEVCTNCVVYNPCTVCGIILKPDTYIFYQYDVKEKKKDVFYVEYNYVRVNPYPPQKWGDATCERCINWKSKWKENCFICGNKIEQLCIDVEKHYKNNGNTCVPCALNG